MDAIQIQDLTKRFNHTQAVRGINLCVKPGEIFSLLGPNGAGKSTSISMVSGLLSPDSGDALIFGRSIRKETVQAQKQVGVVPQEIAIYEDLSARQNLMFWGRMAGLRGKKLSQRVNEVLELVELTDRQNGDSGKFSGGMKRRLNIAIALLHQPALIILDEPTVGIDPQSRRKILDSVKTLRDQGTTILYTTHYMEEAQELSDRIAIMDEGQIIACGTQTELVQRVGEQDHLILKVADIHESDFAQMQKSLPGTVLSLKDGQTIEVLARNGREVLPVLFSVCNQVGIKVVSAEIQEANLEMVFLQLTGKALRD